MLLTLCSLQRPTASTQCRRHFISLSNKHMLAMLAHHLFPINQKCTSAGNGSDEGNVDYRQNGQQAQLKLMSLFMVASRALAIVLVLLIPSPLLANICFGFGQLDTVLSFPSLAEGHRPRPEHWRRCFAYPPRRPQSSIRLQSQSSISIHYLWHTTTY